MLMVRQLETNGSVHRWIKSWLSSRKQRVIINGTASHWVPVTSGVPKETVLEPVLSIIYKNNIDVRFINFISKFADNAKIGNSIVDDCDWLSLQEDLKKP